MPLVAISVDEKDDSVDFAREKGIGFHLLQDADLSVANAYGVAMADRDIAIPATFVIRQDGGIQWRTVGETMLDRASIEEILEHLERARQP